MVKQLPSGEKKTEVSTDTIFELLNKEEVAEAAKSLITGRTPPKEIKERVVGSGKKAKYVNTYYMTRQIALITGFRWSSECLEERVHPEPPNPAQEIAARMRVTIWDKFGNKYSHESWGCVQVQKQGVLYFDQKKAAYSDGIKKCLSYFGIANDVYGGKDLQFLGEEPPEPEVENASAADAYDPEMEFIEFLGEHKLTLKQALQYLKVNTLSGIKDWDKAKQTIMEKVYGI